MKQKGIIKNGLEKLSFLKAAGADRIIFVEFYQSHVKFTAVKRKEFFLKITKKHSGRNFEVIASESHKINSISSEVNKQLKGFIAKNKLQNAYVVAGSNDYKFKVLAIPNEVEDIDAWFSEKAAKIIPEGCSTTDFQYSFEQYYHDENNKYFFIAIARKDYIQRIHKIFSGLDVHLINISPFPLSLFISTSPEEYNSLYLDFTDTKIIYTLVNTPSNIYSGEFYLQLDHANRLLMGDHLSESISQFYLSLLASAGDRNLQKLNIIICSREDEYSEIGSYLSKVFEPESINLSFEKLNPFFFGSYLAFNKLFSDFDSQLNFLNEEIVIKERLFIEKSLAMRFILSLGIILMFFLLFSYISESLIFGRVNDVEEDALSSNLQSANLQSLDKEEKILKSNLEMLLGIKSKRTEFSKLLFDLSGAINNNTCLQNLNAKNVSNEIIKLDITGLSRSQQDIAASISSMEKSTAFTDVTLSYSGEKREQNTVTHQLFNKNSLLQFNIMANYNADKK